MIIFILKSGVKLYFRILQRNFEDHLLRSQKSLFDYLEFKLLNKKY